MRLFLKASLLVCFALTALAQSDRGTITGAVSDPVNAIVPGAAVSARNTVADDRSTVPPARAGGESKALPWH